MKNDLDNDKLDCVIQFRFSKKTFKALKSICDHLDISLSDLIRKSLSSYLTLLGSVLFDSIRINYDD